MKRVLVLVEGSTEQAIFTQVFAPDLGIKGVSLNPRIVGKVGHKGGNNFPGLSLMFNFMRVKPFFLLVQAKWLKCLKTLPLKKYLREL